MSSGRRYFRLLKWYPCWKIAWEKILAGSSSNGVGGSAAGSAAGRGRDGGKGGKSTTLRQMLEGMKYAFLGMYFFLEMLTIVRNFSLFLLPLPPRLPSLTPLFPQDVSIYLHIQTPPPLFQKKKKKIHKLTPVTIQKNSPRKKRPMPSE